MAKNRNFDNFWVCIPTFFAPINVTFGKGERTVYRGNVSPLRGEKNIFGPLSENNTGMAALRAGLLVTKINP